MKNKDGYKSMGKLYEQLVRKSAEKFCVILIWSLQRV